MILPTLAALPSPGRRLRHPSPFQRQLAFSTARELHSGVKQKMTNAANGKRDARRALLLLGPTGSGKTPLGELIAKRGLWQRKCAHFDFGAHLRRLVERDQPDDLISRRDIDFLKQILRSGDLLEDEHFPIAERD